jgi:exoribonuclease R
MKMLADPGHVLEEGLTAIRREFQLPEGFPPEVMAAAERAAARVPSEHVDRTDRPFVTLDPAASTDLDQAFTIEPAGADLILQYAIADVAWFVSDGDVIDQEAWRRGTSLYLPDGKVSLYPPALGEHAASLLPDGPRPAIVFAVRIDPNGIATLDGAERALIRSRAKLGYETVRDEDLPASFGEFARRAAFAEDRRGAARIDVPEQEVERGPDGHFDLRFRPRRPAEDHNAALSLATNIAVAQALLAKHTGLFRTMAVPDEHATQRLRHTARAYGLKWPHGATLAQFQRMLDPSDPRQAAFGQAVHRAGSGARYEPFKEGVLPWHAAVASPYAHATAPLRRLADRYVVQAAFAIANGRDVPLAVSEAFVKLPKVMSRADSLGGRIERDVIDLAEAIMLRGQEGRSFPALVTDIDERGARVQLRDMPVVTRLVTQGLMPGEPLDLRLVAVDLDHRTLRFDVAKDDGTSPLTV